MTRRLVNKRRVYALGSLGLVLVVVVGKLAPHAAARPHTVSGRVGTWLARRALDGIEAIGWVVDRLPPRVGGTGRRPKLTADRVKTRPA